jgi:hypothetical protein
MRRVSSGARTLRQTSDEPLVAPHVPAASHFNLSVLDKTRHARAALSGKL